MVLIQQTEIGHETYVALALADPDRRLELYRGRVWEKPGMSMDHNRDQRRLVRQLILQLDDRAYEVCFDNARLRTPSGAVFVPTALVDAREGPTRSLETYDEPMPFVAEVWSPTTGTYDVDTKITEYRAHGDQEIWRIHPFEKFVTAWRRQPDGTYLESLHTGGPLPIWALPHVTIDLDALLR